MMHKALPVDIIYHTTFEACSSGDPENINLLDCDTIEEAVARLGHCFPEREFRVLGHMPFSRGDFSSAGWYEDHARKVLTADGKVRIDAEYFVKLLALEPQQWALPHIDIVLTSYGLAYEGEPVFVLTSGRVVLASIDEFKEFTLRDRYLSVKRLIWHGFGHLLGMGMGSRHSNSEEKELHCTNPGCTMNQALDKKDWAQKALETERKKMIYCEQCLEDAKKAKF